MSTNRESLNHIAEDYIRLCFYIGKHDPDYVDFYYGPPELKHESESAGKTLDEIRDLALSLSARLNEVNSASGDELTEMRRRTLARLLESAVARVDSLRGVRRTFDEESSLLFGAISPAFPDSHFQDVLDQIDGLLPGRGSLNGRLDSLRNGFIIPAERLEQVFHAAIAEARTRTSRHIPLPPGESFTVEYVHGKPWIAYNWFKGEAASVVQINADLPVYLDFVTLVACHEGYPGHHVFHSLREKELYRDRGWIEVSVWPLYSPLGLIGEGMANFGMEVVFPNLKERMQFEREVLCPLAGIDTGKLEPYYRIGELLRVQWVALAECGRRYIDGLISKEQAVQWLIKYSVYPAPLAENWISFIERYRSYAINYSAGQELVGRYVERQGGTAGNPALRWQAYRKLLNRPFLPDDF